MLRGEEVCCRGALKESVESNDKKKGSKINREASGAEVCTLEWSTRLGEPCKGFQGHEKRVQDTRVLRAKSWGYNKASRAAERARRAQGSSVKRDFSSSSNQRVC